MQDQTLHFAGIHKVLLFTGVLCVCSEVCSGCAMGVLWVCCTSGAFLGRSGQLEICGIFLLHNARHQQAGKQASPIQITQQRRADQAPLLLNLQVADLALQSDIV